MTRLAEISVDDLENALTDVDGCREAQRLIAAIIYKRGPSVPMLADWLDKREASIYEWLVAEFVDDSAIKVTHLPTGSPDLNSVEECWRQLKHRPDDRFVGSVDELRAAMWRELAKVDPPEEYDYLCPPV